ncbi:hypothetical protein AAC387_Pa02g0522 [Persea americana]
MGVCVTGAGGYVASWLVKLLLSKGQKVHGTVQDPGDEKNSHLKSHCRMPWGLPHRISSSIIHSRKPRDRSAGARSSERDALKYAEKSGLDVVMVCPSRILGPLLQPTVNSSSRLFIELFKGGVETIDYRIWVIVDVRDVAEALLLVYDKKEVCGRYICASYPVRVQSMVEKLKSKYPHYSYPKNYIEVDKKVKLGSEKLKRFGWECRSSDETIFDTVEYYREAGILNKD